MEVKVDRRYFSDRLPELYIHPEDARSFLGKLYRALGDGRHSRKHIATVLAWLLCESLGEEETEMFSFFTEAARTGLDEDLIRVWPTWELDQTIRACLRDQLGLPLDGFVEESDEPTLDRIAGLAAAAIASFIQVDDKAEVNDQITV